MDCYWTLFDRIRPFVLCLGASKGKDAKDGGSASASGGTQSIDVHDQVDRPSTGPLSLSVYIYII